MRRSSALAQLQHPLADGLRAQPLVGDLLAQAALLKLKAAKGAIVKPQDL